MFNQQLLSSFLVGGGNRNSSGDTDCSQLSVSLSSSDYVGGDSELEMVDAASEDSDGVESESEGAACGPIPKKAKSSDSGDSGHQRKSGFDPSWKKQHPWVVYNREEDAIYMSALYYLQEAAKEW